MKKTLIVMAALAALVSCKSLRDEWDPVFTFGDNEPDYFVPVAREDVLEQAGLETFTTIAELKAMYRGQPVVISGNVWIEGQVTTSDKSGNIYSELYMQDKTGAINLKTGLSSMYSEYKIGQRLYVKCDGLTLGSYSGQLQLGFQADDTITNEYETSYIQLQSLVNEHVFRGFLETPIAPTVVNEAAIAAAIATGSQADLWGKLVTVKGLVYGNQIYALFYPNPNMLHKGGNPENRVFLSDNGTWGVDTWACTKGKYIDYLESGVWDSAKVGSGNTRYGDITGTPQDYLSGETLNKFGMDMYLSYKEIMIKYAQPNYISHYFDLGAQRVQVRTSGYAKFADVPLGPAILSGTPVSITGIMTIFSNGAQMALIDEPAISVVIE